MGHLYMNSYIKMTVHSDKDREDKYFYGIKWNNTQNRYVMETGEVFNADNNSFATFHNIFGNNGSEFENWNTNPDYVAQLSRNADRFYGKLGEKTTIEIEKVEKKDIPTDIWEKIVKMDGCFDDMTRLVKEYLIAVEKYNTLLPNLRNTVVDISKSIRLSKDELSNLDFLYEVGANLTEQFEKLGLGKFEFEPFPIKELKENQWNISVSSLGLGYEMLTVSKEFWDVDTPPKLPLDREYKINMTETAPSMCLCRDSYNLKYSLKFAKDTFDDYTRDMAKQLAEAFTNPQIKSLETDKDDKDDKEDDEREKE